MREHLQSLRTYRKLTIEDLDDGYEQEVKSMFKDFEVVLGPVGAAKTLHLIAPSVFPLWDRAIADKYKTPLKKAGHNADNYFRFMQATRQQCLWLRRQSKQENILKAIDEYNYCKHTKRWI